MIESKIEQQQQQLREDDQTNSISRSVTSAYRPIGPPSPATSPSNCGGAGTSPSPISLITEDSSSSSSSSNATTTPQVTAPLSRRTHAKSRLGCLTCKRRRVKCNEGRPECASCKRLGLRCGYPSQSQPQTAGAITAGRVGPLIVPTAHPSAYASSSVGAPQASIPMLTLQDLRFYHQFLTVGFPTIPLKADWIWGECAAMSHQYDFLAHALLGLGATHLAKHAPGCLEYQPQALQHRITAIRGVNVKLSQSLRTPQEADALFAAVMCLVAQTSLLPGREGMFEYLSMSRGASLINGLVLGFDTALFSQFTLQKHMADLAAMVTEQPKDPVVIIEFRASVDALRPLCLELHEIAYHESLLRAINALETSSAQAWREFVTVFMMPTMFANDVFTDFIRPDNHVAQLLLVHMFLVDYIIARFGFKPEEAPKCGARKDVVISWVRNVAAALPLELRPYAAWTLNYCEVLETLDSRHLMTP